MLALKGGSMNVPIQTIERIARRSINATVEDTNAIIDEALKSGVPSRFGKLENPLETDTSFAVSPQVNRAAVMQRFEELKRMQRK